MSDASFWNMAAHAGEKLKEQLQKYTSALQEHLENLLGELGEESRWAIELAFVAKTLAPQQKGLNEKWIKARVQEVRAAYQRIKEVNTDLSDEKVREIVAEEFLGQYIEDTLAEEEKKKSEMRTRSWEKLKRKSKIGFAHPLYVPRIFLITGS